MFFNWETIFPRILTDEGYRGLLTEYDVQRDSILELCFKCLRKVAEYGVTLSEQGEDIKNSLELISDEKVQQLIKDEVSQYLEENGVVTPETLAPLVSASIDELIKGGKLVTSVNDQTGDVELSFVTPGALKTLLDAQEKMIKERYGEDNPPLYPVTSVNGQTGAVTIDTGSGAPSDAYTPSNPPPYPVTSVNGQTGAVTIDTGSGAPSDAYTPSNPPPYPVISVNGQTGKVELAFVTQGALNVLLDAQNRKIDAKYDASNPPPYPVSSVNGQTGAVSLSIPTNAYTPSNPPPYPVSSVNGQTGAVTIPAGADHLKRWTGTITAWAGTGRFNLPAGITVQNFISGLVQNPNDGMWWSLSMSGFTGTQRLHVEGLSNDDWYDGTKNAIIYYWA